MHGPVALCQGVSVQRAHIPRETHPASIRVASATKASTMLCNRAGTAVDRIPFESCRSSGYKSVF
jgi:hypothetical protein